MNQLKQQPVNDRFILVKFPETIDIPPPHPAVADLNISLPDSNPAVADLNITLPDQVNDALAAASDVRGNITTCHSLGRNMNVTITMPFAGSTFIAASSSSEGGRDHCFQPSGAFASTDDHLIQQSQANNGIIEQCLQPLEGENPRPSLLEGHIQATGTAHEDQAAAFRATANDNMDSIHALMVNCEDIEFNDAQLGGETENIHTQNPSIFMNQKLGLLTVQASDLTNTNSLANSAKAQKLQRLHRRLRRRLHIYFFGFLICDLISAAFYMGGVIGTPRYEDEATNIAITWFR